MTVDLAATIFGMALFFGAFLLVAWATVRTVMRDDD